MTTIETADGPVAETAVAPTAPALPIDEPPTISTFEPTLVHTDEGEDIFDFSTTNKPLKFRVDGEVFTAIRELPALTAMEFGQYANTLDSSDDLGAQAKAVERMFEMVLTQDSAERFINRLSDVDNPIGARQMNSIMMWMMERYGFRPTAPSEDSSDGS